jgi:hypothetical protein
MTNVKQLSPNFYKTCAKRFKQIPQRIRKAIVLYYVCIKLILNTGGMYCEMVCKGKAFSLLGLPLQTRFAVD